MLFRSNPLGNDTVLNLGGGNLGLGVTPSAWASGQPAIQIGSGTAINNRSAVLSQFSSNQRWNGSSHLYLTTGTATLYTQNDGAHSWATAPSGTAGNTITFTQAMTLDASGNLGVGSTTPGCRVDVISPNNTSLSPTIRAYSNNVAVNTAISYDGIQGNGDLYVSTTSASSPIMFRTNSTERARIDSSGTFRVKGAGTAGSTDAVQFSGSAPASAMTLDSSGNLLVGKTSQNVSTVGAEITTSGIRSTIADSTNARSEEHNV